MQALVNWTKYIFTFTFLKNLPLFVYEEIYRLVTGRMIIHRILYGFPYSLYQSSKFSPKDSTTLLKLEITAVIDLEGGVDDLIGTDFGTIIRPENYLYWPIKDEPQLPDLEKLKSVALWGLDKMRNGYILLTHCAAGHNRSGLVNGRILVLMGFTGKDAVRIIQEEVPGGLANFVFKEYLEGLKAGE